MYELTTISPSFVDFPKFLLILFLLLLPVVVQEAPGRRSTSFSFFDKTERVPLVIFMKVR